MRIAAASSDDWLAITALLRTARLPLSGLVDQFPDAYVVARDGARLAGVAGLQRYGKFGLLRSVAVAEAARGLGIGRALVTNRLAAGRSGGLQVTYLLTTDAEGWFVRFGFERVDRNRVPSPLLASPEFVDACPASAICMLARWEPPDRPPP